MKKILLIEDDKPLAELYEMYLKDGGYELKSVQDGEEGLKAFEDGDFDLVLLDLMIPKMNGFEFLKKKKKIKGKEKTPIIALTALGGEGKNEEKALDLGAREYLVKSQIEPEKIIDIVKKYTD